MSRAGHHGGSAKKRPPTINPRQRPPGATVCSIAQHNQQAGKPCAFGAEGRTSRRLPGTRTEILAIEDSFKKAVPGVAPKILRDGEVTESAVRRESPKYEYLHLATHGFFAPPKLKSALAPQEKAGRLGNNLFGRESVAGFHPGLLSGIALAGANKPAARPFAGRSKLPASQPTARQSPLTLGMVDS